MPGDTPATKAPMDQLQEWFQELTKDGITPARALAVVGGIQEMRPRLTGLALAESHFVEMVAYTVRDEPTGICRAAREVKRLHTVAERLTVADVALTDCP
jgi:urease accessory protein UreF